ncbi:unnamed protein product [Angiostrongylus costaricensis]|uniref:DDE_Tnp_1_7 domain-containing protein n=1 Tax=Angiostrongylus costaricensis TaxID=334426 RepID=A0A0R3PAE8_ANGCS|nr:unnamed protein product [Angiostrongylus costaricensis]
MFGVSPTPPPLAYAIVCELLQMGGMDRTEGFSVHWDEFYLGKTKVNRTRIFTERIVESREPSHYEIEIESSLDSEHWDSDSEDPQDNDENGNDSLEEFGPSQETDDNETGDCEAFAPGQQNREGFGQVFAPLLVRRSTFNISRSNLFQCERWEKFTRSSASSWPKPSQLVKTLPLVVPLITNSTPFLEIDEAAFFTRPMTVARISISRYTKQLPNVCQQDNERQAQDTRKRPEVGTLPLHVPFQKPANLLHVHIRVKYDF